MVVEAVLVLLKYQPAAVVRFLVKVLVKYITHQVQHLYLALELEQAVVVDIEQMFFQQLAATDLSS
jgi:hypothetical protein